MNHSYSSGIEEDDEQQQMEGFLVKQGMKVKSWKKRWFCQKDDRLYYYNPGLSNDLKNSLAVGFIDLKGASLKSAPNNSPSYSFSIVTPTRIWHLRADNEEEFTYWINGIKNLQQIYNNKISSSKTTQKRELELQKEFEKFTLEIHLLKEQLESKDSKIEKLNNKIKSLLQIIKSKDIQLDQKFNSLRKMTDLENGELLSPKDDKINSPPESISIEDKSTPSEDSPKEDQITSKESLTESKKFNVESETDLENLRNTIHLLQKENSYLRKKLFGTSDRPTEPLPTDESNPSSLDANDQSNTNTTNDHSNTKNSENANNVLKILEDD